MQVEFIKGIVGTDPLLSDTKPHIVCAGRSNVGKSSVINAIVGSKIARSSATPGKTREINFFLVDAKRYLVDLPGYGYARLSQKAREKLRKHLLWYLFESGAPIVRAAIVIDAQVGLKPFDEELLAAFREHGTPFLIIANKEDKLTQKEKHRLKESLKAQGLLENTLFMSAKTGRGKDAVRAELFG